jgi:L-lactate utilization protein LutC
MTAEREAFLHRVREAVAAGNRPGSAADLEPRGNVGYQGAGPDAVARFRDELTAAGGHAHLVPHAEAAVARVLHLVREKAARRVLLGGGTFLDSLRLGDPLQRAGVEVVPVQGLSAETCREPFFAADIGIGGVDYLVAETGSVVVLARPEEPRSLSLLPPVHVAVAHRAQLVPDLFDLFPQVAGNGATPRLPSCLTLITGPSKTGDIELRLVTGVHGPGDIHVVLVTG